MTNYKTTAVLIASTLAVIALIIIQVQWMQYARSLNKEEFDNRVRMAVCSAVDQLNKDLDTPMKASCSSITSIPNGLDNQHLKAALQQSLQFYDITLPYQLSVGKDLPDNKIGFTCSATPFLNTKPEATKQVNIIFPDEEAYLMGRMRFMLITSIVILLFIVAVLLLSNYMMLRQKRISEMNVDFFNNMAHEFRTPLMSIKLALSLLMKKDKKQVESPYYGIIKRENQKLSQQVEEVLHLAKMENNDYQFDKSPIQLDLLLQKTIKDLEMQIKAKSATVELHIPEGDWTIVGDKFHLGNAFKNLINNALKYTEKQPFIEINFEKSPDGIALFFKDNGIGICKSNQALIFEKFQRIQKGKRHDYKGFGLGLAYVKTIIEKHRGMVSLKSELNQGSQFKLYLPTS